MKVGRKEITCTRCGNIYSWRADHLPRKIRLGYDYGEGNRYYFPQDLCEDCYKDLDKFLNNEKVEPRTDNTDHNEETD